MYAGHCLFCLEYWYDFKCPRCQKIKNWQKMLLLSSF